MVISMDTYVEGKPMPSYLQMKIDELESGAVRTLSELLGDKFKNKDIQHLGVQFHDKVVRHEFYNVKCINDDGVKEYQRMDKSTPYTNIDNM